MGWDITYHPINEKEIIECYFNALEDPNCVKRISQEYMIDEFYTDKLVEIYDAGRQNDSSQPFNKTHGFYIAVMAGIIRKYWYIRGAAFSFMIQEDLHFKKYCKSWEQIIPDDYKSLMTDNLITENYSSGCYLTYEGLLDFTEDYKNNAAIKSFVEKQYSHGRYAVLQKAINYAIENQSGLLEATEIIEPYPLDLDKSECYSNLYNCDPEGALLFQKAALEQISEMQQKDKT